METPGETSTNNSIRAGKIDTDVNDAEKDAGEMTLQREVSEPPYSIFSSRMKIWIISLVSISALISPFGATLFYPVLNVLSDVLDVTPAMTNVAITTYMVRQLAIVVEPSPTDIIRSLKLLPPQ